MFAVFFLSLLPVLAAQSAPPQPDPNAAGPATLTATPFTLPGASGGIGFDDLMFSPRMKRVLIPGGRTGNLYLIDPAAKEVESIGGFSVKDASKGGHGEGITSVDMGNGWIFASDRTALRLDVVDPASRKIVAGAPLASSPDYVRFVGPSELWVTEPGEDRIEVFTLPAGDAPVPAHAAFIKVPGGPESLVIDASHGRAYTNLWEEATVVIDIKTRAFMAHWPNGCTGSRGLAFDARRGFLFVGCSEGKATVLDVEHEGKILDSMSDGSGVDIVAFDGDLSHLYLPGGKSATMAILGVADTGKLSLLGSVKTAAGSHCIAVDDNHQAWVCDPQGGRLLLVADTLPRIR
ncbi:MAG TPA: hypothetical protein VFG76_00370 [Candidatus Polarisedimenticolia bacterium]|nr:hypothetical protein [Candidatus Polarisedimenticolia bacterium]